MFRPDMQDLLNSFKTRQLIDAEGLLKALFPNEESRPSLRWLRAKQKDRTIPFVKLGRLVFFDPHEVEKALERRTVKARQ
jgi:hypothetical protein